MVAASMGSVPCSHPLPHEEPGLASLETEPVFREEEPVFPRSCPNPEPLEEWVTAGTLLVVGDPTLAGRCWPQLWPDLRVVGVFVFI